MPTGMPRVGRPGTLSHGRSAERTSKRENLVSRKKFDSIGEKLQAHGCRSNVHCFLTDKGHHGHTHGPTRTSIRHHTRRRTPRHHGQNTRPTRTSDRQHRRHRCRRTPLPRTRPKSCRSMGGLPVALRGASEGAVPFRDPTAGDDLRSR